MLNGNNHAFSRERCLTVGPEALSLRECITVVLGTGIRNRGASELSSEILARPGRGLSMLEEERAFFTAMESAGSGALTDIPGLGPASRARLLAAFELGRRYAIFRSGTRRSQAKAHCPNHDDEALPAFAHAALQRIPEPLRLHAREWLGFVALYRSGELGDLCVVERGVRTHVNMDPAELFARVLALRPAGFILFHNHPSGTTMPSQQDRELTIRVGQTARDLGVRLLGHWIVSPLGEEWIPPGLIR
ncbi:MAG: hypothetical protein A2X94_16660 [Bdellovibrionales bacterium GWB1_55_8]|nr:MAG: hypothetical protein A2X94_16660 [Bdellovibrionales bacterium GWB1_55_8]